jgi:hypothetical protein
VHIRAALLWEADGEPHQDDVIVTQQPANGSAAHVVILDAQGNRRASCPADLPDDSVLMLPDDVGMADLHAIRRAGYDARRPTEEENEARWEAAKATSREAAIAFAEAELDQTIARLTRELRRLHPDFFDDDGNLRTEYVNETLLERTGGKRFLTHEDVLKLGEGMSLT